MATPLHKSVLALLLLAQLGLAAAQQAPASREREALRRAQAALRDTTAERDALRSEKAALAAQQAQAAQDLAAARASAAALRPQLTQAAQEAEALRAELARLQQAHAQALAEAQRSSAEREATLQQQLASTRRERDERTAANQALVALLSARTAALQDAQRRNAALHTLSRELIERWRGKTPAEALAHTETLIGIAGVRAEDQAEEWRARADALAAGRTPP